MTDTDGNAYATITVGGADTEATIRKGLAIGADEAVRVDAQPTEALQVAEQIAAAQQAFHQHTGWALALERVEL